MDLKSTIFLFVLVAAIGFFTYNVRRFIRYLLIGKPDNRLGNFKQRIDNVLTIAFGQTKLLRDPAAGLLHFGIFWGFLVLITVVTESLIEGFYPDFSFAFLGIVYNIVALCADLAGVVVLCAILVALFRRHVIGPPRVKDIPRNSQRDATIILTTILFIVIATIVQYASRIALVPSAEFAANWRPVSSALAKVFSGCDRGELNMIFEVSWWVHIVLILGFLNYLPYSKHFHVLSSIPNVYLSNAGIIPRGALPLLDLEDETAEKFGNSDVEDFTWKQLLDSLTCTECGRCTAACPAAATGKVLSPKKILVDMRYRLEEKAPALLTGQEQNPVLEKQLLGDYITPEELWSCTTCLACVQECPVMIDHVTDIVDMRRYLVLTESEFPPELQLLYRNLENNFAPWQFSPEDRGKWADGLDIPTLADLGSAEGIDYLFWVGCAGSFDDRYKNVSRAFSAIMKKSGIRFAILGHEEKCNGDPARRTGNEYLAQMFMQENIERLNGYKVKNIVTACPHCFHALKNEYPALGGNFNVVHHSTLIHELITAERISPVPSASTSVTYHDSCYLGRYNNIFDAPREDLFSVPGINVIEMPRNRDRGFCCGAGGGRMFMEETEGKRINVERSEEAVASGADVVATACPFCLTMLVDGIKEVETSKQPAVKDIAEIIADQIE